jgi:hypothetical protein
MKKLFVETLQALAVAVLFFWPLLLWVYWYGI